MKSLLAGAITALTLINAHAEYRALTDTQGRVIEAEIVMFDARNASLIVKTERDPDHPSPCR